MLNGLDLFSGIGGLALALKPWVMPISYCEIEPYAQGILLNRMECGDIAKAPIWDDVRTLKPVGLPKMVDIIYGGFPCQDISVAGLGRGLAGERSGLYWEIERLVKEVEPRFVFLENVPAIRTRGLNTVVQSLTELGYDCRWTTVQASEVGACHIRKRWFLLAHTDRLRLRQEQWEKLERSREIEGPMEPNSASSPRETTGPRSRPIKPSMVRAGDGLPFIVDRNRALGNAVVPAQAEEAFKRLLNI